MKQTRASFPLNILVVFSASRALHRYSYQATRSHCNVWNFAPSISAAIGNFPLNRVTWRTCTSLVTLVRLVLALQYRLLLQKIVFTLNYITNMINVAFTMNLLELGSLLVISFSHSDRIILIHKVAFGIFLTASFIYFYLNWYLYSFCLRSRMESYERRTVCLKKFLIVLYVLSISVCAYCYWRHNRYCEPGLYSVFSLAEYLVVLTNIVLHSTAYRDFNNKELEFTVPPSIFCDKS